MLGTRKKVPVGFAPCVLVFCAWMLFLAEDRTWLASNKGVLKGDVTRVLFSIVRPLVLAKDSTAERGRKENVDVGAITCVLVFTEIKKNDSLVSEGKYFYPRGNRM